MPNELTAEMPDLVVRLASLQPQSIDEATRSVDAVLATEAPVTSTDLRTRQPVHEVLRMDGAEYPEQIPLLDSHRRDSINSQVGSIRNIRVENGQLVGRLFVSESEPKAWTKIREGHIRDVSIGHAPLERSTVRAGQSAAIKGRMYQAPTSSDLTINTRWMAREASILPIGADSAAKIRTLSTEPPAMAEAITAPAADPTPEPVRSAAEPPIVASQPVDEGAIRQAGIVAERERVRQIHELAGSDVPEEVRVRAINEGWTVEKASREFLTAVRDSRRGGEPHRGPAIHSRSHEVDCNVRSLGMGLMLRSGLDPIKNHVEFREGTYLPTRGADKDEELLRAADNAWQFRDVSLVDVCREACRIDGRQPPVSRQEMIRAAISGAALTSIFTTNVSAMLMQGFMDAADTTQGWVAESEVPNFQTNERVQMGKYGSLQKHGRGQTAKHLTVSDSKEEYRIARYSGQFVVDEMDIIDDRLGAVDQVAPNDMGLTARQLRPNLVYAILLANGTLSDTGALFNSTAITTAGGHANLTTGALASATLKTAIQLMSKQRIGSRPLNLKPRYLIVPQDLLFTALELMNSSAVVIAGTAGTVTERGNANTLSNMLQVVADDRIGVAGVTDPNTGTAYAGSATNYFLAVRPGEEGAKTIEVGYLRGTGRAPQVRSFMLDRGQWGVGWDINMDIGAKALDFRGMVKSTGA